MQDSNKRSIVAVLDSMLAQLRAHLTGAVTAATYKLRDMRDEIETSGMHEVRMQCTAPTDTRKMGASCMPAVPSFIYLHCKCGGQEL